MRDSRTDNYPPRWNAAPSQDLLVIRRNHETGIVSLDPLRWGLIPHWYTDSRRPKADQRQIRNSTPTGNVPGRLSSAALHSAG
jgi:putative SOS response-associated peptidase YedK